MNYRLEDLATMSAVARLEKSIKKDFEQHSVLDLLIKIIVLGLILFIIFYLVLYRAVITGNPIRAIYFLVLIIFIELINFVYGRYKLRKK